MTTPVEPSALRVPRTTLCDRELVEGNREELVMGELSERGPEPARSPRLSLHTSPSASSQPVGSSQSPAFPECPSPQDRAGHATLSHSQSPPGTPSLPYEAMEALQEEGVWVVQVTAPWHHSTLAVACSSCLFLQINVPPCPDAQAQMQVPSCTASSIIS